MDFSEPVKGLFRNDKKRCGLYGTAKDYNPQKQTCCPMNAIETSEERKDLTILAFCITKLLEIIDSLR